MSAMYRRRWTAQELRAVRLAEVFWRRGVDAEQAYGLLRVAAAEVELLTRDLAVARA